MFKRFILTAFLIIISLGVYCSVNKNDHKVGVRPKVENDIFKHAIMQVMGPMHEDTIWVSNSPDPGEKILLKEKGKKDFHFSSDSLTFTAYPGFVCKEFYCKKRSSRQYIFRCYEPINPDNFLVIESNNTGIKLLGLTPYSTADIFGDIDKDGYFEIGGISQYHEAVDTNDSNVPINIHVFKIKDNFPEDLNLSKCLSSGH